MDDALDLFPAQHRSEIPGPQNVALDERHLGQIDDLPERPRLRGAIINDRGTTALHQHPRDLRADQPAAYHQYRHPASSVFPPMR